MRSPSRAAGLPGDPIFVHAASGSVERAGAQPRLRGRERELVIALALQSRPVSGETLGLLLNPDSTEANAMNSAKVYVYRLRATVAPEFVVWGNGGYAFGPNVRVDFVEGRALLDGPACRFRGLDASERERVLRLAHQLREDGPPSLQEREWFESGAYRLRRLGRDLAMLVARAWLDDGDAAETLRIARELTYEDSCDEEAWELLIRAFIALGQLPAAVQGYRSYETVLAKELQAVPSPHIRRLLDDGGFERMHALAG